MDSYSTTLDRISALYAEQRELRERPWQRDDKQQRLAAIARELAAAWQARRVELMRARLLRAADLRCRICGEPLRPWTLAQVGRRRIRQCVACHRARIRAGRQRQIAADRAFVERALAERALGA